MTGSERVGTRYDGGILFLSLIFGATWEKKLVGEEEEDVWDGLEVNVGRTTKTRCVRVASYCTLSVSSLLLMVSFP